MSTLRGGRRVSARKRASESWGKARGSVLISGWHSTASANQSRRFNTIYTALSGSLKAASSVTATGVRPRMMQEPVRRGQAQPLYLQHIGK